MQTKVFSDFDGTIISKNLGTLLFEHLGVDCRDHFEKLISKEISIYQYWQILCSEIDIDKFANSNQIVPNSLFEEIEKFAVNFEVDPYFVELASFCKSNDIPLFVVSDGFQEYIRPILKQSNLSYLPMVSNRLIVNTNISPSFPGANDNCNCFSANCKRNFVLNQSADDDLIVYIGDGISDQCVSEFADLVFAKNNLARYCNDHKIPHHPFKSFFDVKTILKKLIESKKIKKRNIASVKRKHAYQAE